VASVLSMLEMQVRDPHFLGFGTSLRWVVIYKPLPFYFRGNNPRYPLDRRLGWSKSRSGQYREITILDPTWTRIPTSRSFSSQPVATPTALPKFTFIVINRVERHDAPPLWSSGQSSWLQTQRSGFDSQLYQIFWEVVGVKRDPLSLVSTMDELLERKRRVSGLENRNYSRRDQSRWPHGTFYPQNLALTSPTSGGRSVGIVRSRTQSTKFSVFSYFLGCLRPEEPVWLSSASPWCYCLLLMCRWCVCVTVACQLLFSF
jgi:hypothetical protein